MWFWELASSEWTYTWEMRQAQTIFNVLHCVRWWMLTKFTVVITSSYMHVLSHYAAHLKLMSHVNCIPINLRGGWQKSNTKGNLHHGRGRSVLFNYRSTVHSYICWESNLKNQGNRTNSSKRWTYLRTIQEDWHKIIKK